MITASSLTRVLHCPGSQRLVQIETTGEAASVGRQVHRYLELVGQGAQAQIANELPPDIVSMCESLELEALPPLASLEAEVAYAYDAAEHKGRRLGQVGRRYEESGLGAFEVPGTADLVGVSGDLFGVWDFKLGTAEAAWENVQLKLLALAGCLAHGCTRARGHIVYKRGSEFWVDAAEWDLLELEAFGFEVHEMFLADTNKLAEGPWCKWCPAYTSCPAKSALALQLANGEVADFKTRGLTRETYPKIRQALASAYELLEKVNASAHAFAMREVAERGPLDLGNGKALDLVSRKTAEKLNGDVVYEVARELLDFEVASEAIEKKATKKRIKAALKKHRELYPDARISEERFLSEVRKRGGSRQGTSLRLVEVKK